MSKLNQLNLKVLVPMYFEEEDNLEDIFERANSLGMDSLTEDEQYFMDKSEFEQAKKQGYFLA